MTHFYNKFCRAIWCKIIKHTTNWNYILSLTQYYISFNGRHAHVDSVILMKLSVLSFNIPYFIFLFYEVFWFEHFWYDFWSIKNNWTIFLVIQITSTFSFTGFHRSPQACHNQNTSFLWNFIYPWLLENSDFLQLLGKKLLYKPLHFKMLYPCFFYFLVWQLSQVTSSMP